jgi:hypothetical protein
MTTVVPFVPSTTAAFSFGLTLDGDPYNAVVTWSLFGQRFYLNLTASDGTQILTTALIGSPSPLQLIALAWSDDGLVTAQTGTIVKVNVPGTGPGQITAGTAGTGMIPDSDVELEITAGVAHGLRIGSVVSLVVSGVLPDAYNGAVAALITSPVAFTYQLASDPGSATAFGRASYDFNLIGGVPDVDGNFFTSTLVFRQQAQQFEISP